MKMKILLIFMSCIILTSCSKKVKRERAYPLVRIEIPSIEDAPLYIDTIGHVDPIEAIDIRSRIEGEINAKYFKEGDFVKKDDLLFSIDPRPYEALLARAEGMLEENVANLKMAKDKVRRYSQLLKDNYVSKLDFEEYQTDVSRYLALIKQNKAEIETQKINLDYCLIKSPITGLMGILKVDVGNLVTNGGDPMVTINQISPIYVKFSIPEKYLYKAKKYYYASADIMVRVSFSNINKKYYEGKLIQIENQVDLDTGMITMRSLYPNTNKELWPNQFVSTRVILTTFPNSVLIPVEAVVYTTQGPFAYVINKENIADKRKLVLGQQLGEKIIVKKGINKGENIVIEGQINLSDKVKVRITKKGS